MPSVTTLLIDFVTISLMAWITILQSLAFCNQTEASISHYLKAIVLAAMISMIMYRFMQVFHIYFCVHGWCNVWPSSPTGSVVFLHTFSTSNAPNLRKAWNRSIPKVL